MNAACASSEMFDGSLGQPAGGGRTLTSLLATFQSEVKENDSSGRCGTTQTRNNDRPERVRERLRKKAPNAAAQKRWFVTEALVREHGRTMGADSACATLGARNEAKERRCSKAV